jgi:DNA adenine methylase
VTVLTSPLRYPGGKAKLFPFVSRIITENDLLGRTYYEAYAGGAGLALRLLSTGFVDRIVLNDIDPAIVSFWKAATGHNEELCERLQSCEVTIEEWHRQRQVYISCDATDVVSLGFAVFFLNRTSRSGILEGSGPIGGYAQQGVWRLDARLDKAKQLDAIKRIRRYKDQIEVEQLDAIRFLTRYLSDGRNGITYLDPPYFAKGQKLYKNFYEHGDHKDIRDFLLEKMTSTWILSYDDDPAIRSLYSPQEPISYRLSYSAGAAGTGREVIFLSQDIDNVPVWSLRIAA